MGIWTGAGAAGISVVGGMLGRSKPDRFNSGDMKRALALENKFYKRRQEYDWRKSQKRGLTPQEFYGSGAAGGSGPTGGPAQVLGNSKTQQEVAASQIEAANVQNALGRGADIVKANIQADATRDAASIAAGASIHGTDVNARVQEAKNRILQGQLDLSNREFNEVTLKDLAMRAKLNEQEVKVRMNDAINSSPAWVRHKVIMQLGVDNTIQNAILARHNVNIADPRSIAMMSQEKYRNLLGSLLAAKSSVTTATEGIAELKDKAFEKFINLLNMLGLGPDSRNPYNR